MNYAPGINDRSAYGSQGPYGNALLLDGVDTRDPEGGSAWTFFNQNLVQEVQIGGLGAPAEFGGFTGAIVNTVTKSGGNAFAGLFTIRYTRDSLASDNISSSVLAANPSLGQAAVTKSLTDYTVQLGGPLKRDKAFFFASVQRFSTSSDPTGPVANSTEISPRFNVKFTFQPSTSDTFVAGMQYDSYNLTGRVGNWPDEQATDRQTVQEDAPEWVWNFQWRKIFGASAFLEAKFTGYNGYYNLDPVDPSPVHVRRFHGRVLLRRRRWASLQRPEPQPGTGRAHEVRGEVREALAQVRPRNRAQSCPRRRAALRAGRLLHLRLRWGSVLSIKLRIRHPGRQQAHVRVRSGSMDRRETDAEPRPAPGSHQRKQPDSERGCLHARHSLGAADRCSLRSHRQGDDGAEGVFRPVLRRSCDRVLYVRGSRCGRRSSYSHPGERIGPA